ncbi:MAG: hypothetical protein F7C38_06805 [Desulfurococcales archaeon]|nr:hypothetical protein [Desulfurococcales archaeon]
MVARILDSIKELVKQYERRNYDVIYAHHLDRPVWVALEEKGIPESILNNEFVLIGELVHRGLASVVFKADPVCKRIQLKPWIVEELDERVRDRWVRDDRHPYVVVCGNADGMIPYDQRLVPVELKTTRRSGGYPPEWFTRSELYAWLYNAPVTLLAILNLKDAFEVDYYVKNPGDIVITARVVDWLRGKWPQATSRIDDFVKVVEL